VIYLRHDEYLDNFEILWDLFSRDAVESGSIERRFPAEAKPKGSKTLDQDFQEKLSYWRKELAKASAHIRYSTFSTLSDAVADRPSVACNLEWDAIDDGVWAFDQPDLGFPLAAAR
jgi:hypothetical protein